MDAHVVLPASGSGAGILVLQEIYGVNDYVKEVAERLAHLGYVALAPDLYWRIEPGLTMPHDEAGLAQAMATVRSLDQTAAVADAVAALDSLRRLPEVIGKVISIHQRLLTGTRLEEYAGQLRTTQNWIGGSDYKPCSAAFIPPPHEHVESLLEDLCAFCNSDSLPAVAHAAIAHAQFETIHPFVDGNGRTGRALIHVVLRRRGLAPRVLPPVSLALATWSADYVGGLTATRYCGPETSRAAHDGLDQWIALFAAATRRAVSDAGRYEERVAELQVAWRERVGRVRANSAVELLIHALPAAPIMTVKSAAAFIDRSEQAANEAVARLMDADVLRQTTVGRRNRAFEAADLIDALTVLERRLASPEGETRSSAPSRRVPQRPSARPPVALGS